MEVLLVLNGLEIAAPVDEQEHVVLEVASGAMDRQGLTRWLEAHVVSS
jgi:death-on-curing protein